MKKLLLILSSFIPMLAFAQWNGAVLDSLTQNNVADIVNRQCMDINRDYIHVIYQRADPVTAWDIFYRQRDSLGNWSSEMQVSPLPASNAAIAAAKDSHEAYIVFNATDSVDGDQEIFFCMNAGGNWQTQQITNDTLEDVYPSVDVDTAGHAHIAWVGLDTNNTYKIMYATNMSGTWVIQTLMHSNPGQFGSGASPQIAVEPSGVAHIVYRAESGSNYKIDHIYNDSAGSGNWTVDHLTSTNQDDLLATVAISNDTIVHIAISGNGGFGFPWSSFYMTKAGANGNYSQPLQIAPGYSGELGNMCLDRNNVPHFVFNEVSGNIYTGNVIYADSTNWTGTILGITGSTYNGNVVIDSHLNGCLLAYQGDLTNQEEVVFFGPQTGVGIHSPVNTENIFKVISNSGCIQISIQSEFIGRISCYSIEGKEIFTREGKFENGNQITSEKLSEGTYIIKAIGNNINQTIKIQNVR